jgi:hypothetical protein
MSSVRGVGQGRIDGRVVRCQSAIENKPLLSVSSSSPVSPLYINGKYFFQKLGRWPLVAAIVHSLVPDMH